MLFYYFFKNIPNLNNKMKLFSNVVVIKLVKNTLYNSTAQSILKLIETPHLPLKLLLLIYLLIASGISSYLLVQSVMTYLSWQFFTTTTYVFETPTKFPKVTICNRSPFTTKYALEFLKKLNREIQPEYDLFDSHSTVNLTYEKKQKLADKIRQAGYAKMNKKDFLDENRARLGHDKKVAFAGCSFNGQSCSWDDLQWEFSSRYGNCFVFNSAKSLNNNTDSKLSFLSGSDFGLRLAFYAGHHENLSIINALFASGVKLRIENSSFQSENSNGVRISNGFETDILVERIYKFSLPRPYSSCEIYETTSFHSSHLYKIITASPYLYEQLFCFRQCRQAITIENCNCTDPRYLSLFNVSDCETNDQIECNMRVRKENIPQSVSKCLDLCPLECSQIFFNTKVQSTRLIGDLFADFIKQSKQLSEDFVKRRIDADTASQSFVKVNIFYESLSHTLSVDQPKMDIVSLLAYMGGIAGLLLGISAFSFWELLILAIEIFYLKKTLKTNAKM